MRVYSFPSGGLSFNDPSAPSKGPSVLAFLPAVSIIPLTGSSGGNVYPLVAAGDTVREGMLIGRASGAGAVNAHATVPGRVVRKVSWKDSEGFLYDALAIRMEGAFDKLGRREEIFPWLGMNSYDLQRVIADYGVVEMENRGRSLAEMIFTYRRTVNKMSLVVRCVFDDPWLAADYTLCRERLDDLVEGSFIAAQACAKAERVIFAVSHTEKDLGEQLISRAEKYNLPSSLVLVGSRYPQHNRRELELALRMYEKSENLDLGSFIILGPSTLAAVYDAVKLKKPVLDRYVAVGGSAVRHPHVMKVRIGTRINELIEQCGGFVDKPVKIVAGSPLHGRTVADLDEPVDKSCYAVFAMLKSRTRNHTEQNCINCGECRAVCPLGLDPEDLYKRIITSDVREAEAGKCHGCGCCKIVCPSALPLSDIILKEKLGVNRA